MGGISPKQSQLIIATFAVWGLALFVAILKWNSDSEDDMTVLIATKPKFVRININGKPFQNARYIETPIQIPLRPGKNDIKIIRTGYRSHVTTVEMTHGSRLKLGEIRLVPKPNFATTRIEVVGDKIAKPYYVDINRGFFQGATPMTGEDLPAQGDHRIEIYGEHYSELLHRCFLSLKYDNGQSSAQEKIRIRITTRTDGSVDVSSCLAQSSSAAH